MTEPAQGKIVSIPESQNHSLNDLHFLRGRYIKADEPDEVIVSGAFAGANGFNPATETAKNGMFSWLNPAKRKGARFRSGIRLRRKVKFWKV